MSDSGQTTNMPPVVGTETGPDVNNDKVDESMSIEDGDTSFNSTGDKIVGAAGDASINSVATDANESGTSGVSTAGSDVEKLYETVSDISRRQKGYFPAMVPNDCTIDSDMVSDFYC